jgi:hypothetical protein
MQIVSYIVAFALIVLGGDWVLKWLGMVPGSMAGETQWGVFGGVLIMAGLMLMLGTSRRFNP